MTLFLSGTSLCALDKVCQWYVWRHAFRYMNRAGWHTMHKFASMLRCPGKWLKFGTLSLHDVLVIQNEAVGVTFVATTSVLLTDFLITLYFIYLHENHHFTVTAWFLIWFNVFSVTDGTVAEGFVNYWPAAARSKKKESRGNSSSSICRMRY